MSLSKDQRKELFDALLSAFPDKDKLAIMISLELDEKLNNITSGDDHRTRVFYLIEWAESQGKLDDLIKGAYEANSNNPKLKQFYNKSYNISAPSTPSSIMPQEISVPAKYEKLQILLAYDEWKAADQETARVMLEIAGREEEGWLDNDSINKFPCEDLCMIDQLWVKYSNGRFGFSVQKNIWLEYGGKVDYETECKIGEYIGWWVKDNELLITKEVNFSLNAPLGHLPVVRCVFGGGVGERSKQGWVLLLSHQHL
jgi:hypothetical protein